MDVTREIPGAESAPSPSALLGMTAAVTRRTFIQSALAGLSLSWFPSWMPRLAFAPRNSAPRGDVLVVLFLRGAADGLDMVVPFTEAEYYNRRPTVAIARPDDAKVSVEKRAHDLDGFFGLHPALLPLLPAWQAKQLAFVHACGAPDESRSHFQAMELMERGVEDRTGPASGWIGRHLASLDTGNRSPLRAIGLGERVQRSLQGTIPASALRSIADYHLNGDAQAVEQMQAALATLYTGDPGLATEGGNTLEMLKILEKLNAVQYTPRVGVSYPESELGMSLKQVAILLKAQVGLEVACVDVGGWDTHVMQGGSEGELARLLGILAQGLAAFYEDVRDHAHELTVVVMSEFGRRLQENGGKGTDHGHGGVMTLLGGAVQGGRVHGIWPGLQPEQLVGPGDLAATTDYRDVLGEVVLKRLKNPNLSEVFPNYEVQVRGIVS